MPTHEPAMRETVVWAACNALGVLSTAFLTVSNKDLLGRYPHLGGAGILLCLHRCAAFALSRLTEVCVAGSASPAEARKKIPLRWLLLATGASNVSILLSLFVLREASVAFHQLSRLCIMPMSAVVDRVVYSKTRTPLEYSGMALITYAVVAALRGEVTATPRAIALALLCAVATLTSSSVTGHLIKSSGLGARLVVNALLPIEVGASFVIMLGFRFIGERGPAVASAAVVPVVFDPWQLAPRAGFNVLCAASVIYLTTWAQGSTSNLFYAVLGQAKMLATVALGALVDHSSLSPRTVTSLAIAAAVAVGLAFGESKGGAETPQKGAAAAAQQPMVSSASAPTDLDQGDQARLDQARQGPACKKQTYARLCFALAILLVVHDAVTAQGGGSAEHTSGNGAQQIAAISAGPPPLAHTSHRTAHLSASAHPGDAARGSKTARNATHKPSPPKRKSPPKSHERGRPSPSTGRRRMATPAGQRTNRVSRNASL